MGQEENEKKCFVIMPISDRKSYDPGHFSRVYDHIIKPGCIKAGFKPFRADEIQKTNFIVIDILKQIVKADMVICDLSSVNPNVLYELGIRQALNLPVTLIKDSITPRVFDIQGLRDIEYDVNLRIDNVNIVVNKIKETLKNTFESKEEEVNSIIQLLGVESPKIPSTEISGETGIILKAIDDIGKRLSLIELRNIKKQNHLHIIDFPEPNDSNAYLNKFHIGEIIVHKKFGTGKVVDIDFANHEIFINFDDDVKSFNLEYVITNNLIQKISTQDLT